MGQVEASRDALLSHGQQLWLVDFLFEGTVTGWCIEGVCAHTANLNISQSTVHPKSDWWSIPAVASLSLVALVLRCSHTFIAICGVPHVYWTWGPAEVTTWGQSERRTLPGTLRSCGPQGLGIPGEHSWVISVRSQPFFESSEWTNTRMMMVDFNPFQPRKRKIWAQERYPSEYWSVGNSPTIGTLITYLADCSLQVACSSGSLAWHLPGSRVSRRKDCWAAGGPGKTGKAAAAIAVGTALENTLWNGHNYSS